MNPLFDIGIMKWRNVMKYKSELLTEIKNKNRKSFRNAMIFSLISGIAVTIMIWKLPKYLVFIFVFCCELSLIGIFAFIYLTGITYSSLKFESNRFDAETLQFIDSDYVNSKIFKRYCRVGHLYIYAYYRESFLIIPIFGIESVSLEFFIRKPVGNAIVIKMKDRRRYVIGGYDNEQDVLPIANYILLQNPDIKFNRYFKDKFIK